MRSAWSGHAIDNLSSRPYSFRVATDVPLDYASALCEKRASCEMKRREFLRLGIKASLASATSGGLLALLAAHMPVIRSQEILIEGLPLCFDGFRVVHLSDLHHGRWNSADFLRDCVATANSLRPDLVALTGDFIHYGREWVPGVSDVLSRLRARHGVVAVLGNHDHYDRAAPLMREGLRRARITDLTNRGASLHRGGETLHLAGTGDYWREKQKLGLALDRVLRPRSVLLLQHNPDYVERIQDDRVGLVLSGHTHGGQVVLPFIGAPILPSRYGQKYISGLCQGPFAQVFVSTGVGSSFPPLRINCPAEIACLTLRAPWKPG